MNLIKAHCCLCMKAIREAFIDEEASELIYCETCAAEEMLGADDQEQP